MDVEAIRNPMTADGPASRDPGAPDVVGEVTPAAVTRRGVGRFGTLGVIAVTAVIIVAVSVFANNQGGATTTGGGLTQVSLSGQATGEAPTIGKVAPDFSQAGADGKLVSLSAFKGHPVWLTFGASWCQPCRAENPDVVAAYTRHQATGLVVIQVYMGEDAAAVNDYANRVGIPYVKVPDPSEKLASDYRILGIPTHYFIDANGVLQATKIGSLTPDAMDAALKGIGG